MGSRYYRLNAERQPVPCTVLEWAAQFEARCLAVDAGGDDLYLVARTKLPDQSVVSTVFLGLDHAWGADPEAAPILWESLVFGGSWHGKIVRYSQRSEAEQGHAQLVAQVLNQVEWN